MGLEDPGPNPLDDGCMLVRPAGFEPAVGLRRLIKSQVPASQTRVRTHEIGGLPGNRTPLFRLRVECIADNACNPVVLEEGIEPV